MPSASQPSYTATSTFGSFGQTRAYPVTTGKMKLINVIFVLLLALFTANAASVERRRAPCYGLRRQNMRLRRQVRELKKQLEEQQDKQEDEDEEEEKPASWGRVTRPKLYRL